MFPADIPSAPPEPVAQANHARVVLPNRLPAQCILNSAADYRVPSLVLVAMIKTESGGKSVASRNRNGSYDVGVAQHNTGSWVPYLEKKYGITAQDLLSSPCQSIRAQAYALRYEMNNKKCKDLPWDRAVWCGVGRYHAPGNVALANVYLNKVYAAYMGLIRSGRF